MSADPRSNPPASPARYPPPSKGARHVRSATGSTSDCTGQTRRTFLRVGGLSAFGLTLPTYLRARAAAEAAARPPRRSRCILLWMQGGPSHHDTFDPKPDAPAEVRGEFGTIPTTLPGVRFAEHLPLLAKQTDKFSHHPRPRPQERQSTASPTT